jgi:hypothetical protein
MTKTRTLRESSKYLSKRYKFIRALSTRPDIKESLTERDERINHIRPVKDILIYEPHTMEKLTPGEEPVTISDPTVRITRENTNWPFRIEFIEQILEVNQVWVVVADGRSIQGSYRMSSGGATTHNPAEGITLDLIKVERPTVVSAEGPLLQNNRQEIYCEKGLRKLEEPFKQRSFLNPHNRVFLQGRRPEQCVNIDICNILPHNLTLYNCTFFERDVAHLYMESLAEHIKTCVARARG